MELHTAAFLSRPALRRACERYLGACAVEGDERHALLQAPSLVVAQEPDEAFAALHEAMTDERGQRQEAHRRARLSHQAQNLAHESAHRSVRRRLAWAAKAQGLDPAQLAARDARGRARLACMPPHRRTSMAPQRPGDEPVAPRSGHWRIAGLLRRLLLASLVIAQTCFATQFMAEVLPYGGSQPLEMAILVLFAITFGWISLGFWTALAGFALLVSGRDKPAASLQAGAGAPGAQPIAAAARTAIIMPICNESVARVFAGLRASFDSLAAHGQKQGQCEHFDFFVLSDSSDADSRVAEMSAWMQMRRELAGRGGERIYYRWRRHRIKKKSGNVADFCRRWGSNYRYMIVMDADSVMSGECFTRLVRLMEANPGAGIIQTAPRAVGRETLYARLQQFAVRVYGALFTAGLHFWQLGESYYWGHNAIIRVAPFMRHCALARLPGRGALSGEILSHDFVEAALMRRAGWSVWIAYDLPGSYEQVPPNLIDELQRDRRWCQGNLMNFRLAFMRGLHPTHRAMFVIGVMAYASAPLWFASLLLSTALLAVHALGEPQYFTQPYQLFPIWPEWRPGWALLLFGTTAFLLFLPKLLAVLVAGARDARRYGGWIRLFASMLLEWLSSALLAPIRMLFHTQFVTQALSGWVIKWKSPPREDAETSWGEALRRHGLHTLMGSAWAGGVYWLDPSYLWWMLPVVGALILSIPLSVISSRVSLGRWLRRARLLMIPEESRPPAEMRGVRKYLRRSQSLSGLPGFVEAVVDPAVNAMACAAGTPRPNCGARRVTDALLRKALAEGPQALSNEQKSALLSDPLALSRLHFEVWSAAHAHQHWWGSSATGPEEAAQPPHSSALVPA